MFENSYQGKKYLQYDWYNSEFNVIIAIKYGKLMHLSAIHRMPYKVGSVLHDC